MILDTSVLADAERGRFELAALLRAHPDQSAAIAAVSASELLRGVERATASTRQRRTAFVEYVFGVGAAMDQA